ncbi:Acetyltransferase (GNAT) family protein [Penicillium digitatum]|uniref:Acetyltransferase (GNAT) family protein n=1 Tax=Penicillium digitatum TaxID=36651 RepID=A0A7T7BJV7_PENDI|nr:Acetyltransferase (GNAT) family protein [Penicillium digitatum]
MDITDQTVQKIRKFAEKRQEAEYESAKEPLSGTALHVYTRRLDATLQGLQEQVKRQQDELNKLRELHSLDLIETGTASWARISQARRAKNAYDSLLKSDDKLPATDSVLPSLLAIEETARLVQETKVSVIMTTEQLSVDRERLRVEEANLRDSQSIASGLRERIQRIHNANTRKKEQTPSQVAREQLSLQNKQIKELDRTSASLKVSLDNFIDETLAPMLAAEDLGGPTVGDTFEVSDATLKAGYTAHGKPKKQKEPAETEDASQQRIDKFMKRNADEASTNKRETAAKEMHGLLDAMLEADSYIDLERDSASSRFLVRAKVAQFHPRDARRLRLIDFGRSLAN